MPAIITIEESASMRGTFMISVKSDGLKRAIKRASAGRDPGAAAAVAMQAAISHGGDSYTIFAPQVVLAMIPEDMRSKR